MLQEILEAIRCREETVPFLGKSYLVREVSTTAHLRLEDELEKRFKAEGIDATAYWALFVNSIFDAQTGLPLFAADDIPALSNGSRMRLGPLTDAVNRVNGLDEQDNAKK